MSTFEVNVVRIDDVYDHPNADRLSIVKIGGYEAVTMKAEDGAHRFFKNQAVVYVPEGAVVPDECLKTYGFWNEEKNVGMLSGSKGNRVKAIRLRGVLSQGLVWDAVSPHESGLFYLLGTGNIVDLEDDVAHIFGITKYEPPIPLSMTGKVVGLPEAAFHYDIENYQKFPELFDDGESIVVTEKLHGTFCRVSYIPGHGVVVASKGLGSKGLVFSDEDNVYTRVIEEIGLDKTLYETYGESDSPVHIMGEIFGPGIQDLTYGQQKLAFKAFDVYREGKYLRQDGFHYVCKVLGIETVPILYEGPFDLDILTKLRDGKTTLGEGHIREGIVVKAAGDQTSRKIGNYTLRPILKMISPDYLTRKGGSEYT